MQQKPIERNPLNFRATQPMIYHLLLDYGCITEEYLQQYGNNTVSDGVKLYSELCYLYIQLQGVLSGINSEQFMWDNDLSTSSLPLPVTQSSLKSETLAHLLQNVLSLKIYYLQLESESLSIQSASWVRDLQVSILTNLLSTQRLLLGWIPTEQDESLRTLLGKLLVCSQTLGTYLQMKTQSGSPIIK